MTKEITVISNFSDVISNGIGGIVSLFSKRIDAKTVKEIAIYEADNKLIVDVVKQCKEGLVILGCGYFIYKGVRYAIDKGHFTDLEVRIRNWFNFSIKADR